MMIKQVEKNYTELYAQVGAACRWLKHGYNSILGGDKLSAWLEGHLDGIEGIFGSSNYVYIKVKTRKLNQELVRFVAKEKIGDMVEWQKFKDADRWWLCIWWD